MANQILVSLSSQDRAGLIKELAAATHALEGSWVSSKFCHLEGLMSGIVKIDIDANKIEQLKQAFAEKEIINLDIHQLPENQQSKQEKISINIEANDRSGLIADITHILSEHNIKIDHFDAHRLSVMPLGNSVLQADLDLLLPAEIDFETISREIEGLGDRIVVNLA